MLLVISMSIPRIARKKFVVVLPPCTVTRAVKFNISRKDKRVRCFVKVDMRYNEELTIESDILELCHGKSCLKIFAIVIPKEGLAGPQQSLFAYDTDYKIVLWCLHRLCFV